MTEIELVIKMSQESYNNLKTGCIQRVSDGEMIEAIKNGTLLPKGHGRLIDISKIDDDRIDGCNPVICLTINGEYIEAVSLDYLNSLPPIIEADGGDAE